MKTATYPALGSRVEYLRAEKDGSVKKGVGVMRSLFIDPNGRAHAQVKDGDNAWNIDFNCVNPEPGFEEKYAALIKDVQGITKEGNDIVRKTVEEYNNRVAKAYDAVIGPEVELEEATEDAAPEAPAPQEAGKAA